MLHYFGRKVTEVKSEISAFQYIHGVRNKGQNFYNEKYCISVCNIFIGIFGSRNS